MSNVRFARNSGYTHPAAMRYVQIPKPIPTSFARESFFAVSAFKFTNADGANVPVSRMPLACAGLNPG